MNIYCYYAHVERLSAHDEIRLILEWKDNWRAAGFTPIVLSEYVARQHPRFPAFAEAVAKLPSVNPGDYDKHCYYRWLAMAQIGGGIMSDYDLFNYGWQSPKGMPSRLHFYQGHVPCLVTGDAASYMRMVDAIIAYKVGLRDDHNGKPHVSDMTIASHEGRKIDIVMQNKAKEYGEEGWESAPAVHYSTSRMTPAGKLPRYQHIKNLRPWITP